MSKCQSNIKTGRKKAEKEWPVDPDAHISTWGDTKTSTAVVSKNEHHSHINHHSKKKASYIIANQRHSNINIFTKKALQNNRHGNSLL